MKTQETLKDIEKKAATEKTVVIGGHEIVVRVFPAVKDSPSFYRERAALVDKIRRRPF